ncbi:hypothetical protein MATL_G00186160 [Megalops atlanticus]|uniref:C2H2-type domain-containing protein n=1 Tax=Megalops atlanticus TaxID=7932 RepID=A0A9D3PPH1_MEGAT|nr:hypothetical protein MATL_G00186160 [Megalops atlanticus]
MFSGGRPQLRGHDQQFAPCEPTPYDPPPNPSTAPFGPDLGPAPCHLPPGPYPYGTGYVEEQERDRHGFTPHYKEEYRRSPSGRRYPPGSGENHGLGSGPPREHTSKPLDPSLLHGGFSIDHSLVLSIGNGQTCSSSRVECSQFPDPRRVHSLGQEHLKNERASEEFLSCLAAKEKYPVPERAADKGDPHYRPPHPGKGPGRKELEEMLSRTSTMKKPLVSENKPPGSSQTRDPLHEASAEHQSSVLSREKVQLMRENLEKGQYAEPEVGGVSEFLLPHERVSQDSSGFSRILGLMGERRSIFMDIEDEEEFLYGDAGESQGLVRTVAKSGGSTGIGDHLALGRPHLQAQPDIRYCQPSQPTAMTSERDSKAGASRQLSLPNSRPPGVGPQEEKETPNIVDFEKIKKALQTIGLEKNLEEICNMASRTRECLVTERLEDGVALPRGRTCSASQKRSDSPSPQRDSRASKMDTLVNLDPQIAHMGISHPQRNFDENGNKKRKVTEEGGGLKTDRQILMKRKEYLMKELEILLKQQGSDFLVPVIGFYCQVCEEFLGDIASADNHAMCHSKGKHKKHADGLCKLNRNIDVEVRPMELKQAAFKERHQDVLLHGFTVVKEKA